MKEIDELNLPGDIYYTKDHEWAQRSGGTVKVGISDYAQDQMGDIVFVELPEGGTVFQKGEEFGTLESVKAVSEVYVPISGEIVAVNEALLDAPELLNEAPYENWIIEIKPADENQYDELLNRDDYLEILKG
jgi:glycine cleavage system H protein